MSPYLVLLLSLEFFPVRLATLPYGLDSTVTKLLANPLTKPSVFYYYANCILCSCFNKNYFYYYYYCNINLKRWIIEYYRCQIKQYRDLKRTLKTSY